MRGLDSHRNLGRLLALGLIVVVVGASAGVVLAAAPKKGGTYVGLVPETAARLEKRLVLKVSDAGIGTVRLACGDTRVGLSRKFEIVRGKFTAVKMVGSDLVWRLKGKFTSRSKAKAKLYLPAVCDGKGGKVTLELEE